MKTTIFSFQRGSVVNLIKLSVATSVTMELLVFIVRFSLLWLLQFCRNIKYRVKLIFFFAFFDICLFHFVLFCDCPVTNPLMKRK